MNTGKAIKVILKKRGMTQTTLAEKTGLSQTAISQIVKGHARPHPDNLDKIANTLKVPVSLINFIGMEFNDIPENKQQAYLDLQEPIMDLFNDIYFNDDTTTGTDNS